MLYQTKWFIKIDQKVTQRYNVISNSSNQIMIHGHVNQGPSNEIEVCDDVTVELSNQIMGWSCDLLRTTNKVQPSGVGSCPDLWWIP
jgi:methionine aminopeptidase